MTRPRRIGLVMFGIACGVVFVTPWPGSWVLKTSPPIYVTNTTYGLPFSPWYEHAETRLEAVLSNGERQLKLSESGRIHWLSVSWVLPPGVMVGLWELVFAQTVRRNEHRDQTRAPEANVRDS